MATTAARLAELGMVPPLAKEIVANLPASDPDIIALTPIATADATDLATVLVLANATKAKVNAIIAALKT